MAEKTYFTIKEAAKKTRVPEHTIRYWESGAGLLRPLRLSSGHRRYTAGDLELITEVKDLILIKGYTLTGAGKVIRSKKRAAARRAPERSSRDALRLLEDIRKDLLQIIREC